MIAWDKKIYRNHLKHMQISTATSEDKLYLVHVAQETMSNFQILMLCFSSFKISHMKNIILCLVYGLYQNTGLQY